MSKRKWTRWTEDDDNKLRKAVLDDIGWHYVNDQVGGDKGIEACRYRWFKVLCGPPKERYVRERMWTPEEDEELRTLFNKYYPEDRKGYKQQWETIAHEMSTYKSAKQCKVRWYEYLQPKRAQSNMGPWTKLEDLALRDFYKLYGSQWSFIARMMDTNRSPNNVKNHFHTLGFQRFMTLEEPLQWDSKDEVDQNAVFQDLFVAPINGEASCVQEARCEFH